jgi:hypothetical protein
MVFKFISKIKWLATFLVINFSAYVGVVQAQSLPYQIAGNKIGVKELTLVEANDIMKGKRNFWANQEEISIGLPSSKAPHAEIVASSIYRTTVTGMQKYWLSLVFQGRGKSPLFFASSEDMLAWLEKTPGAIGVFPPGFAIPSEFIVRVKTR